MHNLYFTGAGWFGGWQTLFYSERSFPWRLRADSPLPQNPTTAACFRQTDTLTYFLLGASWRSAGNREEPSHEDFLGSEPDRGCPSDAGDWLAGGTCAAAEATGQAAASAAGRQSPAGRRVRTDRR